MKLPFWEPGRRHLEGKKLAKHGDFQWRFGDLLGYTEGNLEDHPINPRTRKWVSVRIRAVGLFQNDLFMAYKWW